MKQYYLVIKNSEKEYWCGDSSRAYVLLQIGNIVLPLGGRKPKNVSRETIKQF